MRKITFAEAKRQYPNRFTMEHVPQWAKASHYHTARKEYLHYAPQHGSDREWYENTVFPGEGPEADRNHCFSTPSWPLGHGWLKEPFHMNRDQRAIMA
ncbi:hypothetical protein FHW77_002377 [Agrobacterium sp. RC10-4-1]|nr:hypothetical protein [Agrobacterium sp. RC10-4-1]MDP9775967.1 hypothetical protein [Rhizobium sp. SORGH_AS_0755]